MDAIWTPTIPVRQLIGTILSVTFVFVTGCAGDVKTDRQLARERANGYVAAYSDLDANVAAAIRDLVLVEGMTPEQVTASWGKPVIVQKSINKTSEMWYFPCEYPHFCRSRSGRRKSRGEEDQYQSRAFFVNGRLTEWQN